MQSKTLRPMQNLLALAGALTTFTASVEAAVITSVDQILVNSSNVTTANGNPSRTDWGGTSGIGVIGNLFKVSATQQAGSLGFVDLLNTATAAGGGSLGSATTRARPISGKGGLSASLIENGGGATPGGSWINSGDGLLTSHTVVLVEWDSVTPANSPILASATVAAGTSGYYFNGFRWVDLVTPVTLDSSKTYAVLTNVFLQAVGLLAEGASLTQDGWSTNPGGQNGTTINYVLGNDFGASISSTAGNPTSGLYLNNTTPLPSSGTLGITPSSSGNLAYGAGNVALVPEPSTALLGGLGLLALIRRRR